MTIREAKLEGVKKLHHTDNEAPIDAEILLAHCLNITREELLAHDERKISAFALRRFRGLVARRRKHEPIAYLIGHREFFGLQFEVNRHVLIPRPETEMIVEEALKKITHPTLTDVKNSPYPLFSRGVQTPSLEKGGSGRVLVLDVGTGSGAIAVAIAKNCNAAVIATDSSKQALKIAERNAVENDVDDRIDFRHSDLLPVLVRPDQNREDIVVVANLPYIPTVDWRRCMPDVKSFEPRAALEGGPDGLRVYDRLFHQIIALDIKTAAIICEIDPSQKKSFPKLVKKHFPDAKTEIKNDLASLPRVGIITL
jgi:release factor glutamine methyltransferase